MILAGDLVRYLPPHPMVGSCAGHVGRVVKLLDHASALVHFPAIDRSGTCLLEDLRPLVRT